MISKLERGKKKTHNSEMRTRMRKRLDSGVVGKNWPPFYPIFAPIN